MFMAEKVSGGELSEAELLKKLFEFVNERLTRLSEVVSESEKKMLRMR